jgi:hypothetical protein
MFLGLRDPHPVLLVSGTDPRIRIRIRIRTKMSRIRNTGLGAVPITGTCFFLLAISKVNYYAPLINKKYVRIAFSVLLRIRIALMRIRI